MPKVEIDYSNTIIYKITCNDSNVTDKYVGHTTNFVQRKHAHKNCCLDSLTHTCKLYKTIRQHGGWSNWTMEIIHVFNCKNQHEARQKEQEYFELLKANLNSTEPLHKPIMQKSISNVIINETIDALEENSNFVCKTCDFKCSKKGDWNKHIIRPKHMNNMLKIQNDTNKDIKNSNSYTCECGNKYTHHSGLWRHKKNCNYLNELKSPQTESTQQYQNPQIDPNILLEIIKQNQELQKQMIDFMKTNSQTTNNTNTNCNNINNNSFNLNLFLNEKCKDAININDFVDNIKMQLSDLENFGHLGYVEGVSRILIKNLKELDAYSRPIHCSDFKREVLYIKDNNCWTKETDDKHILKNAIKQVANKNIKQIQTWKNENPECTESESKKNDQYINIVMNSMSGGTSEEQSNNISQIVKNISKVVVIEKQNE